MAGALSADALLDLMRAIEPSKAVGRVLCNEQMMQDARLIAPSPERAYLGLPISVSAAVPDGHLILLDRRGDVIGIVTPTSRSRIK